MGQFIHMQVKGVLKDIRAVKKKMLGGMFRIPEYQTSWINFVALLLTLVLMVMLDIIWCLPHYDPAVETSAEISAHAGV